MAAGNVGIAAWTQLRSINTGEPRPIVALDDVAVGETLPVPLSDRRRPGDPPAPRRPRGRRVQPEVHPPRLRRLLRGRATTAGTARATRATSRPRTGAGHLRAAAAAARTHRRRDPRRRPDLGARQDGREDAPMSVASAAADRRRQSSSTSSSSSPSRCSSSPSPSRRSSPTTRGSPGRPPACRSSLAAGAALFLRYLRP